MSAPTIERPSKLTSPAVGLRTPVIVISVVVLPAPLWPTRPTSSPSLTSSDSCCTAGIAAVVDRDVTELEQSRAPFCPRYAATTALSRTDLLGRADGDRLAVVEHVDPLADPEDDAHVVLDEQHAAAEVVADSARSSASSSRLSASSSPAAGSSRRRNFGPTATARAMPTRRSSPCGRAPSPAGVRRARGPGPRCSSQARARAVGATTRRRARRARRSRTPSAPGTWRRPGTSARARSRTSRCGDQPVTSSPSSETLPAVSGTKPRRRS